MLGELCHVSSPILTLGDAFSIRLVCVRVDDEDLGDCFELKVSGPTSNAFHGLSAELPKDAVNCFKVTNTRVKAQVIQRDDDLLAPHEVKAKHQEVSAAMDKELRAWVELGCVSRKPRAQARNIIDARWALKWKWE